jgi:hypothetical protein
MFAANLQSVRSGPSSYCDGVPAAPSAGLVDVAEQPSTAIAVLPHDQIAKVGSMRGADWTAQEGTPVDTERVAEAFVELADTMVDAFDVLDARTGDPVPGTARDGRGGDSARQP